MAGLLLAEAERLIAAAGHRQAWLAVVPGNVRARRFYERCGWSNAGLFNHQPADTTGPVPVPCCRYIKPL